MSCSSHDPLTTTNFQELIMAKPDDTALAYPRPLLRVRTTYFFTVAFPRRCRAIRAND